MDIQGQIFSIISEVLGVDVRTLDRTLYFRTLPDVSSMKVLQIILEVEKCFEIELDDELTFTIETIGQFVQEAERLYAQNHEVAGAQ
jgi:acyl carrier protein